MNRKTVLLALGIVAFGSIATLVSGLFRQDLSHRIGVSVVGYGFPSSWYKETWIAHPIMPVVSSYCWECFALDIVFWSLVIAVPVTAIIGRKSKA